MDKIYLVWIDESLEYIYPERELAERLVDRCFPRDRNVRIEEREFSV